MKYTLILVEDDAQIRMGLSRFFPWEDLGFEMAGAFENGLQALDYVRTHPVDVILTDVRMPVMDGLEMLERMRMENLHAYVVILSAYREFEYARKAIELGVSNYIVKSTRYDELTEVFRKIHESLSSGQDAVDIQTAMPGLEEMNNESLSELKEFIDANIAHITLQAAAEHIGYSPIYLSRLFKEKTGVNFVNYLIDRKMRCAADLLKHPEYTAQMISEKVGYSNEKNFSRAFKKFFGVSPAEYRKLI